jgi:hypothetical protein
VSDNYKISIISIRRLRVQITSGSPICGGVTFFGSEEARVTTSMRRSSWCYWSVVDCDGRATSCWSQLTALLFCKTAGSVAVHWGSLDGACCSVKTDEARKWVDPAGWGCLLFADLLLSLVTLRLPERATWTALLGVYMLTGPRHLADWRVFYVYFCCCLQANSI